MRWLLIAFMLALPTLAWASLDEALTTLQISDDVTAQQQAFATLEALAESGDARAQYAVGEIYRLGFKAIESDIIKAWYYIQRAAAGGDVNAMLRAAQVFTREGAGIPEVIQGYIYASKASEKLTDFPDADTAAQELQALLASASARLSEDDLRIAHERLAQGRVAP